MLPAALCALLVSMTAGASGHFSVAVAFLRSGQVIFLIYLVGQFIALQDEQPIPS